MNRDRVSGAANARSSDDAGGALTLRRFAVLTPRIIAIGASTGGPQALSTLLARLAPQIHSIPVVIVLHLPSDFTDIVVTHVGRLTGLPTSCAAHGSELQPGHIYFAPGASHLKVVRIGQVCVFAYSDAPPENFCKPAVDVLFRSVADAYGPGALAVVLTGMGSDGLVGARKIVDRGGSVIAQDEASSVVWGMPGEVARAGLAAAVSPIGSMADVIANRLAGARRRAP
jgi:two-component system, chemotaxis family, protein-glutamate methylesterase/glutaminase